jgi:hypothetical protein
LKVYKTSQKGLYQDAEPSCKNETGNKISKKIITLKKAEGRNEVVRMRGKGCGPQSIHNPRGEVCRMVEADKSGIPTILP